MIKKIYRFIVLAIQKNYKVFLMSFYSKTVFINVCFLTEFFRIKIEKDIRKNRKWFNVANLVR